MDNNFKLVDTFQNRLNYALTVKNIRPFELADRTGISRVRVTYYLSGRNEPKTDGLSAIARYLDVNPVWLMGYDVPMKNVEKTNDKPLKVAIIGKISAGLPILASENIEGYEFAPSTYLKSDYDYFYLKVQGDSMNLKFNEGNLILVQKQDFLENNEIGVFLINDMDATVKKYKFENDIVILEPMSTNINHQVQIYKPENVKIIGKVILSIGEV